MTEQPGTELEFVTNSRAPEPNTHDLRSTVPGTGSHRHGVTEGLFVPPGICARADVRLAHEQMRAHLTCRIERCAWKAAAYRTLVITGRLTPQAVSHRERAAARGIGFPSQDDSGDTDHVLDVHTIQAVLEQLSALAAPPDAARG
ncbi:hypothetical protein [Nocardia implantans]|uniref:Uncharacterized protein n=1 Tax=Nocardia implantans TaxID=3108168 RepID=A0ABU6B3H9_9NOCA|nr:MULTISPECIES: hypothetical protein [unclassified Nocardia]MBF6194865.1 hypothetical protein [Nocardia beijingensis]MEA3530477.1 hypothetical protein [Nocardia sp. CDC192]MEB3514249.1 hypothetical protein [Nocardia sp. CDC186]